ncbi:DUF1707 and DUF4190 domain-containing protein [Kitasatospora humi]|uniref:DUF1707 and DUF4190 domain-containing protein n=1 Tax=Kitasatospora humi TaxID=2893891 RepID=UPI0027DEDB50|nr:DUF1707 and DUF4190 domain-containing protein [Kitasatospora humi]
MGDVQSWPGGWQSRQPAQPAAFGPPAPAYGAPVPYGSPHAAMRAAHTDRERTVDVLKAAYAEGRLSAAEYGERFEVAHSAQTYGQLAQLVADLPAGPGLAPPVAPMPVPATFMPPPARPAPNNSMAVASLVLGLLCVPTMGALGLPAVITGHVARGQISRTKESGDGMATAGLVLGYLSVAGWAMMFLFGLLLVGTHG